MNHGKVLSNIMSYTIDNRICPILQQFALLATKENRNTVNVQIFSLQCNKRFTFFPVLKFHISKWLIAKKAKYKQTSGQ